MPFCTQCGKETPEGEFCQHCGKPIGAVPPVETSVPPPSVPTPPPPPVQPPPGAPFAPQPAVVYPTKKPPGSSILVFGIIGAAAMLLVAIGSVLTWDKVSIVIISKSFSGLEGDGWITLVVGLLTLAFFIVGLIGKARWPFIVSLVGSVLIVSITLYDTINVATTEAHSAGYGLIICLIMGIVGLAAGICGVAVKRQ